MDWTWENAQIGKTNNNNNNKKQVLCSKANHCAYFEVKDRYLANLEPETMD